MKSKLYIIALIILINRGVVLGETVEQNYVCHTKITTTNITDESNINSLSDTQKKNTITYYDGLGRPIQSNMVRLSPGYKDVIQVMVYDQLGREQYKYLPYSDSLDGGLLNTQILISNINSFYTSPTDISIESTTAPYAESLFESSPRNLVLKQGAAGSDWQLDQHPVAFDFQTNNASDEVLIWDYNPSTGHATCDSLYADGSIYISETTDENGNVTKEYKDKQGKVILKCSLMTNDTLHTYYVYDEYGNLGTVIPPKAYAQIYAANNYNTAALSEDLVYTYKYDYRQRMIEKKIPGQEATYMVYDKLDRLVLVQDGNMRNDDEWLFTKYDAFSRPVITGVYSNTATTQAAMQTVLDTSSFFFETFNPSTKEYSNQAFPTNGISDYLTYTYYDDYSFIKTADTARLNYQSTTDTDFSSLTYISNPKGLATGTKVKILGSSNYLLTATYYDNFKRPIQNIADHAMDGYDVSRSKYDFTGKVEVALTEHNYNQSSSPASHTMKWWYTYDHAQRLTSVEHQINSQTPQLIIENEYNELGQLIEKNLHANNPLNLNEGFWQSLDYRYNIRGWLKSINDAALSLENDDLFGMKLNYNEGFSGLNGTAMYNGNISGMKWIVNDDNDTKRGYGFQYDEINRLAKADYGEGATYTANNHYDVSGLNGNINYDENGNILSLYRKGENTGTSDPQLYGYGDIDQLSYTYNGNQLTAVNDAISDIANGNDFKDRSSSGSNEYTYDDNGNMISDANKGISNITYNILNLPAEIDFGSGDKIVYIYSADGTKLEKQVFTSSSLTNTKTYTGSYVYTDGSLEYALFDEGRLVDESSTFKYQYFLKDHLGNTRVTFTKNGGSTDVLQQDHYYPFGMNFGGIANATSASPTNFYKYNGKELQDDHGLDWYDYGARFYDPVIARWHSIDPLAEDYFSTTPFSYVENNPIAFIDPDGRRKFSFNFSIKLTSGKAGVQANVAGVGVGGNYNFGGNEQVIGFSVSYDTDKGKLSASASYTQKTFEKGGYSAKLGPFGGSKNSVRETKYEISTDGGAKKTEEKRFKTVEEGSYAGVVGTENKEGENTKYKVGGDAEINALMIGVGASVGLEYENTSNSDTKKSSETKTNTNSSSNTKTNSSTTTPKEKKEKII